MISIANTTDILLAPEVNWGEMSNGAYIALPILTETIVPEKRLFQPTHLGSQRNRAEPVTTETLVAGDLEAMASASLLRQLFPLALRGAITVASAKVTTAQIGADGTIPVPDIMRDKVQFGDVVWIESDKGKVVGFHDVIDPDKDTSTAGGEHELRIGGLPQTLPNEGSISIGHASLHSGKNLSSVTLARRYGQGSDWMFFHGMMIRRLVLDLAETDLPAVTASFLGRSMKLQTTAPETVSEDETGDVGGPLGLGADLQRLELKNLDDSSGFTLNTVVLTRLRLIVDHAGMSPQFALGDLAPVALLSGQLSVHGMIEVLITDAMLFAALNEEKQYRLTFTLQDTTGGGCAIIIPSVLIDAVEGAVSPVDGPVRVRFHFRAVTSETRTSLIKIFFDER
ncbi:phage tail tube protein [Alphaproteobacteria bacterium LSUCC0684]